MARAYTLTPSDAQAINETAARLGIQPEHLAAVIAYETAGTMNPDIKGGTGGNYQGLIQFGPPERKAYGFRQGMSFADQVRGPVFNYLEDRGVKPGHGIAELYSIVNAGSLKNGQPRWNASDRPGRNVRTHVRDIINQVLPRMSAVMRGEPYRSSRSVQGTGILRRGARGDEVEALQASLKAKGYDPGPVDGIFGRQTEKAVRQYQQIMGLGVDGIVGPETGASLDVLPKNSVISDLEPPSGTPLADPVSPLEFALADRPPLNNPDFPPRSTDNPGRLLSDLSLDYLEGMGGPGPGRTPETMTADQYVSRADTMPLPPLRPDRPVTLLPVAEMAPKVGAHADVTMTQPEVDIPLPTPRPDLPATVPPVAAYAPNRGTTASDQGMQIGDRTMAQGPSLIAGSQPTPPQDVADRMQRSLDQFLAEMDARAGTPVPQTDYYTPDFDFAAGPGPVLDLPQVNRFDQAFAPSSQGTLAGVDLNRAANMPGRFADAFAPYDTFTPPSQGTAVSRALDSANDFLFSGAETGLSDLSNWLTGGGAPPVPAAPLSPLPAPIPPPSMPEKDQSRVPMSNGPFTTPFGESYLAPPIMDNAPPRSLSPVLDTVDPIRLDPVSSIDSRPADMTSVLSPPMGQTRVAPQVAWSGTGSLGLDIPPNEPPAPAVATPLPSIPGTVVTDQSWNEMAAPTRPTMAAASPAEPIDIRPPAQAGPTLTPMPSPATHSVAPQPAPVASQRQGMFGRAFNTIVDNLTNPDRERRGGLLGGGLLGALNPFNPFGGGHSQSGNGLFSLAGTGTYGGGTPYSYGTFSGSGPYAGNVVTQTSNGRTFTENPGGEGFAMSLW